MNNTIFIDTSAFLALYIKDDAFHTSALQALEKIKKEHNRLITSNFILDEVYTFLRVRKGKALALDFALLLSENSDIIKVIRITVKDEQEAFRFFTILDGKGISFTDCTSFALMKRTGVATAFAFDNDFTTAGLTLVP